MADTGYAPEDIAAVYRGTFAARDDAFADWFEVPGCTHGSECQCHWVAVREELSLQRILDGLKAKRPVSTYMETVAGTTHVGALDFDRDDGWALGLATARRLTEAGGHPLIERSRRGSHVWVVLDEQIPADLMRLALRHFVSLVSEYAARDPKVEILPKKFVSRGPSSLGAPLRMPMMAHQRTGVRYPLCDIDGKPIGASVSACLLAVELTDADLIVDTSQIARVPQSEVRVPEWARRPQQEGGDVVEILMGAGVASAAPGRAVKCPLHDDSHPSLSVSRDGQRVWCKSASCVAYNNGRGLGADQLANALRGVDAP
jgi:hypothetical protein